MAHVALIVSSNDATHGESFLNIVKQMESVLNISIPKGVESVEHQTVNLKTVHALLSSYLKFMLLLPGETVKDLNDEEKSTLLGLEIIDIKNKILVPSNDALQRLYNARDNFKAS